MKVVSYKAYCLFPCAMLSHKPQIDLVCQSTDMSFTACNILADHDQSNKN